MLINDITVFQIQIKQQYKFTFVVNTNLHISFYLDFKYNNVITSIAFISFFFKS